MGGGEIVDRCQSNLAVADGITAPASDLTGVMELANDDLENKALDARNSLANFRKKYPKHCANWLRTSIKNDIKVANTFEVTTGDEVNVFISRYENRSDLQRLGLDRKIPISDEKIHSLAARVTEVSKALDFIGKMKTMKSETP